MEETLNATQKTHKPNLHTEPEDVYNYLQRFVFKLQEKENIPHNPGKRKPRSKNV